MHFVGGERLGAQMERILDVLWCIGRTRDGPRHILVS